MKPVYSDRLFSHIFSEHGKFVIILSLVSSFTCVFSSLCKLQSHSIMWYVCYTMCRERKMRQWIRNSFFRLAWGMGHPPTQTQTRPNVISYRSSFLRLGQSRRSFVASIRWWKKNRFLCLLWMFSRMAALLHFLYILHTYSSNDLWNSPR